MKCKLFCILVLLAACIPVAAQNFELALGYQRGLTKNLSPEKAEGESDDLERANTVAFSLHYFFLPSVAISFRGSIGTFETLVWRNPAYDYIKDKSSSQLDPGWEGFTGVQLHALKDYLPKERYEFTNNDGTLLALNFLLGAGTEFPLFSPQLLLAGDLGISCHYKSVSYQKDIRANTPFESSVSNTTLGLGLVVGIKYRFTPMFYTETGASAAWDFIHSSNITVKVNKTTVLDVSSGPELINVINFGAPYILLGVRL
jgi:hypothetical protein